MGKGLSITLENPYRSPREPLCAGLASHPPHLEPNTLFHCTLYTLFVFLKKKAYLCNFRTENSTNINTLNNRTLWQKKSTMPTPRSWKS